MKMLVLNEEVKNGGIEICEIFSETLWRSFFGRTFVEDELE